MKPTTLALAALSACLAVALVEARRDAREGFRHAAFWQRECAGWMDDSSQQARIIAGMNEGEWLQVEWESVH